MDADDRKRGDLIETLLVVLRSAGSDDARASDKVRQAELRAIPALRVTLARLLDGADHPMLAADIRTAQIDGLRLLLDLYQAARERHALERDPAASGAAAAFLERALEICRQQRQIAEAAAERYRGPRATPSTHAPTSADLTDPDLRRALERTMLGELDVALGPVLIPDAVLRLFQAEGAESTGWINATALYLAARLQEDGGLTEAIDRLPAALIAPDAARRLVEHGRQLALRFDRRLASPDPIAEDEANAEIAGYLERLPREIGRLSQLPEAAIRRIVRRLGEQGSPTASLEVRLAELLPILRLASAFARGPTMKPLAELRGDVERHLAAGRFDVAASLLAGAEEERRPLAGEAAVADADRAILAELQWARALVAAVRGDAGEATELAGTAILTLGEFAPRARPRFRLLQALILLATGTKAANRGAIEILSEVAVAEAPGEAALVTTPACQALATAVLRLGRPQRHVKSLALAAKLVRRVAEAAVPVLQPLTRAELRLAEADIAAALARIGAERHDEIAPACDEAIRLAREAGDVRLTSIALARRSDSRHDVLPTPARPGASPAEAEQAAASLELLTAAQTPGLRARDPLWWAEVKLMMGEALLAAAGRETAADRAEANLLSAVIALKAALRVSRDGVDPAMHGRAMMRLGEAYAQIARTDRRDSWRRHALACLELALASLDPATAPALVADTHMRLAAVLLGAEPDAADTATLETAAAHYQSAAATIPAPAPRWVQASRLQAEIVAMIGRRRFDLDRLDEASALLRSVLREIAADATPNLYAQCWISLATVGRDIARLTEDAHALDESIARLAEIEPRVADAGPPWLAAALRSALRDARETRGRLAAPRQSPPRSPALQAQPPRRTATG